jgi:hypothetical protein
MNTPTRRRGGSAPPALRSILIPENLATLAAAWRATAMPSPPKPEPKPLSTGPNPMNDRLSLLEEIAEAALAEIIAGRPGSHRLTDAFNQYHAKFPGSIRPPPIEVRAAIAMSPCGKRWHVYGRENESDLARAGVAGNSGWIFAGILVAQVSPPSGVHRMWPAIVDLKKPTD